MVGKISHWDRDSFIEVVESRGGTLAVTNPWDNLVRAGITPWPPPEILQKLYQSHHAEAFGPDPADLAATTRTLGFYSDLQSLHSEDALTWSIFGPLVYSELASRRSFLDALLNLLELSASLPGPVHMWLWRRFPHPDTRGKGGPELDFGLQAEDVVVLGEAKWRSPIARMQGVDRDKDQMRLRHEFLVKYGEVAFPSCTRYVLLGLSPAGGLLPSGSLSVGSRALHHRSLTWEALCELPHPVSREIRDYLNWKLRHSKPMP